MKGDFVFGTHAVKQILETKPEQVLEIFFQQGKGAEKHELLIELAAKGGVAISYADRKKLDTWTGDAVHQGVLARCKAVDTLNEKDLVAFTAKLMKSEQVPFYLVLDAVTDPHNLGACLRTADAAGVHGVIVAKDKTAKINGTVRKVAAGAAESCRIFSVTNLARALDEIKQAGVWVVGTALDENAQSIHQADFKGPLALVMGSEGKGLRRLTQDKCDFLVYIPMAGSVQSINVSVATGVCLFEALRQRA